MLIGWNIWSFSIITDICDRYYTNTHNLSRETLDLDNMQVDLSSVNGLELIETYLHEQNRSELQPLTRWRSVASRSICCWRQWRSFTSKSGQTLADLERQWDKLERFFTNRADLSRFFMNKTVSKFERCECGNASGGAMRAATVRAIVRLSGGIVRTDWVAEQCEQQRNQAVVRTNQAVVRANW